MVTWWSRKRPCQTEANRASLRKISPSVIGGDPRPNILWRDFGLEFDDFA